MQVTVQKPTGEALVTQIKQLAISSKARQIHFLGKRRSTQFYLASESNLVLRDYVTSMLLLPAWKQALQSAYQPGDLLELRILRSGKLPYQGQSHLEDGSLVFVTQAAPYIGQTVRVQVAHVLYSVTGFVMFANLVSSD
uniref:Uncharacterized protein ycf81 n=1 Tax=Nephroselmis olivacea TaxID=31312 RepID=YCF81_NEPOL|nr:hypothetical chloroplast RF81 [Nephroselmis olivacea]Q9TKX7.1 RecName: Full=Uncharacterized protein ycf81; Short=RF81 [Nephroselmis olivacea]AAD54839.1 hypothetical chloroplast RF81 [Nephroselmis olivacea]